MLAMKNLSGMNHMKSGIRLVAIGLVLASSAGQQAWAAQQKEEDSVYRWGRWAVLSPAAGGDSYEESVTPDAANNARPGDAQEFQPEVASVGVPPPVQPPVQPPGPPSIGPVDPTIPVVTAPPTLPTFPPSIGNQDPSEPVVTAPPTLPVFGGTN